MVESCYSGTIKSCRFKTYGNESGWWNLGILRRSCRFPENMMVMKVDGGIFVFWDDQILQISKKHYGTPSRYRLPPLHPTWAVPNRTAMVSFVALPNQNLADCAGEVSCPRPTASAPFKHARENPLMRDYWTEIAKDITNATRYQRHATNQMLRRVMHFVLINNCFIGFRCF